MSQPEPPQPALLRSNSSVENLRQLGAGAHPDKDFGAHLSQAIRRAQASSNSVPKSKTLSFSPALQHPSRDGREKPRQGQPGSKPEEDNTESSLGMGLPIIDAEAQTPPHAAGEIRWRSMPHRSRLKMYMLQEVAHNHYLEAQLLLLTVATGIVDAMTFTQYNVFVSKQTGNTIFLALYASDHPSVAGVERNVGASIGAFILGSIFFGHVGHLVKQRRRSWLLISNAFQCALFYVACAIRYWISDNSRGPFAIAIVILLSFACGGQISLALCVKLPELNTTMVTGCLIQLSTDRHFFKVHNEARDRRVLFYCSILAGAFIGSAATSHQSGTLALLLSAIVKTIVGASFLFNHGMVGEIKEKPNSGTATPLTRILWGD